MTIAAILQTKGGDVHAIAAGQTMREAVELLAAKRIGAAPVLENGRVIGIVSERDVLYGLAREGQALLDRRVEEVMTAEPVTVTPGTPVLHALATMTRRRIRHLPVIDEGALAGFVSIGDLVKRRIDQIEAEADAMRTYIAGN
jgi:CBS domain-containing protein